MFASTTRLFLASLTFAFVAAVSACSTLGLPSSATQTQSTLGLSDAELRGLGQEAFLYGRPAAELARLRSTPAVTNTPLTNTFTHLRGITPAGTGSCCPNQDTLYSTAWLDVSEEPVVLTIPPLGGRYFVAQTVDIHTRNRLSPSRRTVGSAGAKYLITGMNWKGSVPAGMTRLDLKANDGMILFRIAPNGDSDLPAVNALQDQITLKHPSGRAMTTGGFAPYNQAEPFAVLKELDRVVRRNPIGGKDGGIAKTLAALGIGTGAPFDPDRLSVREREILLESKDAANALLERHLPNVGERRGDWTFLAGGETFEDDIFTRAAVAVSYILPNDFAEAIYPIANADADGNQLSSAHTYIIDFDGPVPVGAFWSVIAYDWPAFRLQPNAYGKYSVGDRTKGLVTNADGGMDIVLSRTPPSDGNTANWLPVPEGDFGLALRLYEPSASIIDGRWPPPRIRKLPAEATNKK